MGLGKKECWVTILEKKSIQKSEIRTSPFIGMNKDKYVRCRIFSAVLPGLHFKNVLIIHEENTKEVHNRVASLIWLVLS